MKFPQRVNVAVCTLSASVFFVLACNLRFWQVFIEATGGFQWHNIALYLGSFFIIVLILNVLLTLFAFRCEPRYERITGPIGSEVRAKIDRTRKALQDTMVKKKALEVTVK